MAKNAEMDAKDIAALFRSGCFYPFSTLLGGRIAAMSHGTARIRLGRVERVVVAF
jgi:hypothetical protein